MKHKTSRIFLSPGFESNSALMKGWNRLIQKSVHVLLEGNLKIMSFLNKWENVFFLVD